MSVTLRDIDLYLKRRAVVESPGLPNEQANARRQVEQMEEEFPGISEVAVRVSRALAGDATAAPGDKWQDSVRSFVTGLARNSVDQFAERVAGDVTGATRFDDLPAGKCRLRRHACAPNQVCLEIRVRRDAILKERTRGRILDRIEDDLVEMALES